MYQVGKWSARKVGYTLRDRHSTDLDQSYPNYFAKISVNNNPHGL